MATELETLLLQQLEQQQRDSEQLVAGLSAQLERLQTALEDQQTESTALRRELAESDRRHAEALDSLTRQFEALAERLSALGKRSNG